MYKIVTSKERITRHITDVHSVDNYITKETTPNISLAINKLSGQLDTTTTNYERIFYFIKANVNFTIENEVIHFEDGDSLYLAPNSSYSASGTYEAVVVNSPAFGVLK